MIPYIEQFLKEWMVIWQCLDAPGLPQKISKWVWKNVDSGTLESCSKV
jgi:hypothetical protein